MSTTDDVIARTKLSGSGNSNFFAPETMAWWNSRLLGTVHEAGDVLIFITSEREAGHERRYSVRTIDPTGHIVSLAFSFTERKVDAERLARNAAGVIRAEGLQAGRAYADQAAALAG